MAAGALGAAAALAGAGLVRGGGAARPLPGRAAAGRLRRRRSPGHGRRPGPAALRQPPSERGAAGRLRRPGPGARRRLPVCLLLHSAAGDERAPFERLRLHHHLAQAVGAGGIRPFALASADGRGSGWRPGPADDLFGMLLEELAPLLSGLGLRTGPGRLGVLGWSMGGAGALRLAETHPGRLAAVVAASLAIAETGPEVAAAGRLSGLPVKVDCGANDPFAPATRALAATLPAAEVAVAKGCHDGCFWQLKALPQLRLLASAFASGVTDGTTTW